MGRPITLLLSIVYNALREFLRIWRMGVIGNFQGETTVVG